jgi:hypothetical protein
LVQLLQGSPYLAPAIVDARDAETALALGLQVPLGCIDATTLELIPKLSTNISSELIKRRDEIIDKSKNVGPESALREIYGIGEATARHLLKYLALTHDCREPLATYNPPNYFP